MKKLTFKKVILYILSFCFACFVIFVMNHSSVSELVKRLSTAPGFIWSFILFVGVFYAPIYSFGMWKNNQRIQQLVEIYQIPEEQLPEITGIAKKYFVSGFGNKITVVTEDAQKIVIDKLEKRFIQLVNVNK